jgi:uncharacterized membrane protein
MKVFGHPLHVMLIHFPVGLLPAEGVLSLLAYFYPGLPFTAAAFYCLVGGVVSGYVAILSGLLDLIAIPKENKLAIGAGLLHGFVNGLVVLVYSIFAYKAWQAYPRLETPSLVLLVIKALLLLCLFIGNFLGGKLIYKHHIGISKNEHR